VKHLQHASGPRFWRVILLQSFFDCYDTHSTSDDGGQQLIRHYASIYLAGRRQYRTIAQWLSGIHLQSSRSPAFTQSTLRSDNYAGLPEANYHFPPIDLAAEVKKSLFTNLTCIRLRFLT